MNMQPDWMRGVFGVDRGGKICYSIKVRGGSAGDERRGYGGIGRRAGFRFQWSDPCGFEPHYPYHPMRSL